MHCTKCGNPTRAGDNFCSRCGATVEAKPRAGIVINGRELTHEQIAALQSAYGFAPLPGRYWYDSHSGAWGLDGREAAGFILTGHDFGPLSPDASRGNTGVFINGRQINLVEASNIQRTFGAVYPGRLWLDGTTGNFGMEENPFPLGNLAALLQSQHKGSGRGDNFWSSATACGNDDGNSGYVSFDGVTVGYDR